MASKVNPWVNPPKSGRTLLFIKGGKKMAKYFTESAFNDPSNVQSLLIKGDDEAQVIVTTLCAVTAQSAHVFTVNQTELEQRTELRTVTVDTVAGQLVITLSNVTDLGVGSKLVFKSKGSTISRQEVRDVVAVNGVLMRVTLSAPLNYAFKAGDYVYRMDKLDQVYFDSTLYTHLFGECIVSGLRKSPMQIVVYGARAKILASGYWNDIN